MEVVEQLGVRVIIVMMSLLEYYSFNHSNTFSMHGKVPGSLLLSTCFA